MPVARLKTLICLDLPIFIAVRSYFPCFLDSHLTSVMLDFKRMIEEIQQTRFENGLVVLTDRMSHVRSATLGFFFRVGARHEPVELNGITHFIEHTVFKGTKRRSALEIAVEQDRLGGNLDAFTTHEETGFAIKVIDDQLEAAFDLLADILINPAFDEKELESEQRVIIEEMKMTDDSPEELLGELFSRDFFPNSGLGRSIAGTPESVRKFGRELTCSYHSAKFQAANLVVVAAGNIEHEQIVALTGRVLNLGLDRVKNSGARNGPKTPTTASSIAIHQKSDLEQAHLIIGLPFVSAVDKRRYAADLLTNAIGGGMSSRLWQKIREDRGLAYSVGASNAMYSDCGVFSIFAGTSPEQTGEVVDIAVAELSEVVRNGISEIELELAKDQARASILMSLEDSAARAASLAQSEMVHGRQIPVEETLAQLDAVTVDDTNELAREFFRTEAIAFAAIGDLDHLTVDRDRLSVS
jgi:predicted Zn-dependent peptidase